VVVGSVGAGEVGIISPSPPAPWSNPGGCGSLMGGSSALLDVHCKSRVRSLLREGRSVMESRSLVSGSKLYCRFCVWDLGFRVQG